VLKMARLQAMGQRRRTKFVGRPETGRERHDRDEAIRTALREMRRGGVDIDAVPPDAMELLVEAHTPDDRDKPVFRERGKEEEVKCGRGGCSEKNLC
jgi:hypothetical protein